jgi:hypothetical protein
MIAWPGQVTIRCARGPLVWEAYIRTALIIGGGVVLLAACVLFGRWLGGVGAMRFAIGLFIPVWLVIAAVNMWFGVARAGYSLREELPVFTVIFLIPVLVAVWVWWRQA